MKINNSPFFVLLALLSYYITNLRTHRIFCPLLCLFTVTMKLQCNCIYAVQTDDTIK